MDSREIVRRTLDFENPPRVAHSFEPSDYWYCYLQADTPATEWEQISDKRWRRTDEWGNIWERLATTSGGEIVEGVMKNLDDIGRHEFPDYANLANYEHVKKERAEYAERWLIGCVPGFTFSIARKIRKLDQYLMDLVLEPERIHQLHDRIDALLESMIRNYAAASVDAILFWEDWGTQEQLFIAPKLWVAEFLPRFEKLCSIAHDSGIRVFMHSCGKITAIIPHLIAAGIDLFQFDQPELHGLDTLACFQGKNKISFWCPVDIQKTLQTRNEQLIRAKVREMLDKLWRGRGGFIAGFYSDNKSIGLDPKWQQYACEEFVKHGVS